MYLAGAIFVASIVTCAGSVFGSELIHLRSGFDLEGQSHTINGSVFSVRTTTGTIELTKDDVLGIDVEADDHASDKAALKPLSGGAAVRTSLISLIESAAASQASTPEFVRFVRSVAQAESALRENATSSKGATGLMQLMPMTAKELGVVGIGAKENVEGGAKYLRELLVRYHNDSVLALAAYNAGPEAVKKYAGVPPYLETRRYIQKVLQIYAKLQTTAPSR